MIDKNFSEPLMQWYKKQARDLPWRNTRDPYKIWISEIMLQQTTVNAVIPYYEKWVKVFPIVADVAKASEQKILKLWQGLGYYSRAKNIHKSAQLICEQHDQKIPRNPNELRKLPGFGPYTVGAVLSIAFDMREPIIDANVRRVVMRFLAQEGYADTTQDKKILKFLDEVMPAKNLKVFNQAMMELGALVCRNREPLCSLCPVHLSCKAYQKGIQEIIPRVKKKVLKNLDVSIGVIQHKEKYFIQQRPSKGLLADLWEFPGGKIEKGETSLKALKREIQEEIGCEVESAKRFMQVQHFYTQFRVNLHVFFCQLKSYPAQGERKKWVSLKQLKKYPMPSGSVKIVDKLSE
ncbi:A/G-specific adenine glycosylase [hydrothermal vent metagenome]|uniref:Adenine DNA glycosylase n=1 Tax=hydrothermal vent metagenome TaxID=652676 RepID=A0A3B1D823_9ZZZZ